MPEAPPETTSVLRSLTSRLVVSDMSAGRSYGVRDGAADDDHHDSWRRLYARRLWITDLAALVWVVFGTQIAWLGIEPVEVSGLPLLSYSVFSMVLVAMWMWALSLIDSRNERVIGTGPSEYARVADASLRLFGLVAIAAFLLKVDVARGFLLISLPLGILVLVLERWLWRQWLVAERSMGRYSARVLLVGSRASVAQIARELRRTPHAGYLVVGACVPSGDPSTSIEGTDIPIIGDMNEVGRSMSITHADTVAITSTDDLPPSRVKEISWSLEAGRQHLVLAPSIIDIAGPRIHTRPVSGLPLIHVETPQFNRGQRVVKRTTDIVVASSLLIVAFPLMAAVALAVKISSDGPVLFLQERIGRNGEPFRMIKFRSMHAGAEAQLANLLVAQGTASTPLFKVSNDPRITAVGRFIRKYSLDELPQLLNVAGGSMSLVGPRPQIAEEVALYSDSARRRLLARPGITGLWQVSGRSGLAWDDAIKLDLYYVENWSLIGDIAILARTARTVLNPGKTAH